MPTSSLTVGVIMFRLLHHKVRFLPTPMAGLALGIASLGVCLEQRLHLDLRLQIASAVVAGALWLMLTLKFLFHPKLVRHETACPLVGSVLPTYAMAGMMLSKSVGLFSATAATALWLFALCLHLLLLVLFVRHRLRERQLDLMLPSWFVPPVGIIVAALTCPLDSLMPLARALMWQGMVNYVLLLPLMIYRLLFRRWSDPKGYPTFAIMAAPASLTLAGYLAVIAHPDPAVIWLLLPLAVTMTTLVYLSMAKLLRLPFSPGYAAFTFPLVISATALYQVLNHAAEIAGNASLLLGSLADLELAMATIMVSYVSLRYLHNYLPRPATA